jgi:hypothetical protein
MSSQKIPREHWVKFFNDFSKKHMGWITNVELMGKDIGDQLEASGLPLVAISADLKDGEHSIEISLGGQPDSYFTHIINTPQAVEFEPAEPEPGVNEEGGVKGHEALEVTSADGTITLVTFRYLVPEPVERQLPE